ncbi:hypothetical protein [Micromonospora sp. NPDC005299]|uniref:hypothetical protein n=1 Tax=Micromonospora sp. NPDC005299 TaxID=3364231 RepID=UPI0036A8D906
MTAVPLPRIVRRHKPTPQLNPSVRECPICWAGSLTPHERWCNEVTGPQGLPHPAEARVFRGLPLAVLLGALGWVLFFAFLIWSN